MKLTLPRGSLYVTLPLVALGIAYYFGIFRPNRSHMERLRVELRAIGKSAGDAQQLSAKLGPLSDENEALTRYLETWEARLAEPEQLSQALGRISQLAKRSGVSTTRLEPAAVEPVGSLQKLPLEIQLEGSFQQVYDFLKQLEESNQAIWVEKMEMSRPGNPDEPLECELSLVVFAG